MWRFLVPALAMMAALIVLFAGALGDLRSLPDVSNRIIGVVSGVEPRDSTSAPPSRTPAVAPLPGLAAVAPPATAPVAPPATTLPDKRAEGDQLQRQIADLQGQISNLQQQVTQRSHDLDAARTEDAQVRQDLAAARAETGKLRQDIDALRQQRKAEETALARQKTQEQLTSAAPPRPAVPQAPTQPMPTQPVPTPSSSQQLLTARQWLATGRPDEARRILAMVQTQMVLRPVTPDQPTAQGTSQSAAEVGNAIRWLDLGANSEAMQAINRAIDSASRTDAPFHPWSGYQPAPPPRYPQTGMQDQ